MRNVQKSIIKKAYPYLNRVKLPAVILLTWLLVSGLFFPAGSLAQKAEEPTPPPKPMLNVVPGDGEVFLYWDDRAEQHFDAYFDSIGRNPNNFEGYKIYKSTEPQFIDALRITDNRGNSIRLAPEAQYDLVNDIRGYHPASIQGTRFFLGNDTGIQRTWVDRNVINGRTYYYAVVAYTHGDAVPEFPLPFDPAGEPLPNEVYLYPPLESPVDITVHNDGSVVTGINTAQITPRRLAAGVLQPQNPVVHRISGSAGGTVSVDIIDPSKIIPDARYSITFEDTIIVMDNDLQLPVTKNFSLFNHTTGSYVFDKKEDFSSLPLPIREGFLLTIESTGDTVQANMELSEWQTDRLDPLHGFNFGISTRYPKLSDYRIEFGEGELARSSEFTRTIAGQSSTFPEQKVSFKVFNDTSGEEIPFAFAANVPRSLRSVFFVNNETGFNCGEAGVIQKTTDGGQEWSPLETGIQNDLNAIFFINESTGFAAGIEGVILKTTNGGEFWETIESNTELELTDIFFRDDQNGFIVGTDGILLKTTDGGTRWEKSNLGTNRLNAITFIDQQTGYATGRFGRVFKTEDGGNSWEQVNSGFLIFNTLYFVDENQGWVAGNNGRMIQTTDGGETWHNVDTGTSKHIYGIDFFNQNDGIMVAQDGVILVTSDGGASWKEIEEEEVPYDLYSLFIRGDNLWITGENNTRLRSSDKGGQFTITPVVNRFRSTILPNGNPSSDEIIFIEDFGANQGVDTWRVRMVPDTRGVSVDPADGDVLKLVTVKPFTSADEYEFSITAQNLPLEKEERLKEELDNIRVVPNPYLVTHLAETKPHNGRERQLHFTNLPATCTIRIFSVSGRLIKDIEVNNPLDNDRYIWDMKTNDNQELPYGVYIYHIKAPGIGETTGKFAVVK